MEDPLGRGPAIGHGGEGPFYADVAPPWRSVPWQSRVHDRPAGLVSAPRNSRSSQAFASFQSRMTVSARHIQRLGGFLDAQAAEEPQLDDPALSLVDLRQLPERIVEGDQVAARLVGERESSTRVTCTAPPPRFW